MTQFIWRAICEACGGTVKENSDRKWMHRLFIPSNCPHCGDGGSFPLEFGQWIRVNKFKLLKPSTWVAKWKWEEK